MWMSWRRLDEFLFRLWSDYDVKLPFANECIVTTITRSVIGRIGDMCITK
jgi:hypothetical protein